MMIAFICCGHFYNPGIRQVSYLCDPIEGFQKTLLSQWGDCKCRKLTQTMQMEFFDSCDLEVSNGFQLFLTQRPSIYLNTVFWFCFSTVGLYSQSVLHLKAQIQASQLVVFHSCLPKRETLFLSALLLILEKLLGLRWVTCLSWVAPRIQGDRIVWPSWQYALVIGEVHK